MFTGLDFIYNNIPSDIFDFKIISFDDGMQEKMTAISYKIIEDRVQRRSVPYFYGTTIAENLSFEMIIGREKAIDRYDKAAINKWLFTQEYKDLKIIQDDLQSVIFKCIFTEPEQVQIGNIPYALRFTVICNAPYGFTEELTSSYNFTEPTGSPVSFYHYAPTSVNEYVYPILTISTTGTEFSIKNVTDNNRITSINGLNAGSPVNLVINNDLGIITKDTLLTLSGFNKKWFRLLPGNNELQILKGTGSFSIKCRYPITF